MSRKKKKKSEDREAAWAHIASLLEKIEKERKEISVAFTRAKEDYINEGGSRLYFPMYLKETYGVEITSDEMVFSVFPSYTIVDIAKYEFFALRYL